MRFLRTHDVTCAFSQGNRAAFVYSWTFFHRHVSNLSAFKESVFHCPFTELTHVSAKTTCKALEKKILLNTHLKQTCGSDFLYF